jgi:EAL domain-containing protein (putative c-di-GMP-specific phosphodiesterase class I)
MLGEDGSLIYPGDFLGSAERYGLVRSVDRWVVRQAIRIIGRERKLGRRLSLSVNLSGKSLGDLDFTMLIEEELRQNEVDASQLTLEITETAAIADTERAKIFVMALKQIGCRLALDDFGVGFSSMNHLKILPIDYLKIDGSFIRDLATNRVDRHLVHAMVEVAKALRKRTVAEFVGSDEILKLVREAGVDYVQGFHVGKPVPIETVLSRESASAGPLPRAN